jgi:TfoX/Sxy family transcriptional regulator of competence genes
MAPRALPFYNPGVRARAAQEEAAMAWTKSPQTLVELFTESLPADPAVQPRKMFGYPAAFVNGNMFAGLFQDAMFARLPPELRGALERDFGARPFEPMAGRPMRDYLALPDEVLADEAAVARTLAAAFAFAAALPPKVKTPKTSKS